MLSLSLSLYTTVMIIEKNQDWSAFMRQGDGLTACIMDSEMYNVYNVEKSSLYLGMFIPNNGSSSKQ